MCKPFPFQDFCCHVCGERRYAALLKNNSICRNCHARSCKRRRTYCVICKGIHPFEMHHIIPQMLHSPHLIAQCTVPLCLNCHTVLTRRYDELILTKSHTQNHYTIEDHMDYAFILWVMMIEERISRDARLQQHANSTIPF